MVALAKSRGEIGGEEISVEERTRIAMQMWKKEKVFAIFVLVACWVVKVSSKRQAGRKEEEVLSSFTFVSLTSSLFSSHTSQVYFILLLYSFVSHLRQNSYRALPLTTASPNTPSASSAPKTNSRRGGSNKIASGSNNKEETEGEEQFNWDSDEEGESRAGNGAGGANGGAGGRPRGDNIV